MEAFRGDRYNIAILGRCNTGKSSLLNTITGQQISLISQVPGTTADPVNKPFELLPFGPVTFYDTAGLDENSPLGFLRSHKSREILKQADLALIVTDEQGLTEPEKELINQLKNLNTPFIIVFNKQDLRKTQARDLQYCSDNFLTYLEISATADQSAFLRNFLAETAAKTITSAPPLLNDLLPEYATVFCVCPIDSSAPKGRLIVPQVTTIRALLDNHHLAWVMQTEQLDLALAKYAQPDLVITDSQAIKQVYKIVPETVPVTTFSILFARQKADLNHLQQGALHLSKLKNGDKILVAESCSHHPQADDIARFKIPDLLKKFTQKNLSFNFSAGSDFPDNLAEYNLVIHCGSCMLTRKQMLARLKECQLAQVPITNFGMAMAQAQNTLQRSLKIFNLKDN